MRSLGSDNHSGTHPQLIAAILAANQDHAPSYGTDPWSDRAQNVIKKAFGNSCEAFFVFNGTGANVLALKSFLQGYETVLCSDVAHLHVDECAAPESIARAKLWALPSQNGKLSLEKIKASVIRRGDQHFSQVKMISLTQPTEYGTLYSIEEIREICQFAHQNGLLVHVDGARLANAAFRMGLSFKEITFDLGVDVVSLGGTKNGFLFGEAVLIRDSSVKEKMKYFRKQICQLPSKTRYIAAQFEAYLGTSLWFDIAKASCEKADELGSLLKLHSSVELTQPIQSNAVFAKFPSNWIKELRQEIFFYVWNEHTWECRLMTSWDTKSEDLDKLNQTLRRLQ